MKIPRNIQADFYRIHLEEQEREYEEYLLSQAQSLYKTGRLFAGQYVGFDPVRGNILVRFKSDNTPRKKQIYTCFKAPKELATPSSWSNNNYIELRKKAVLQLNSDCISIYYTPFEEDASWLIVGFSQVEMKLAEILREGNTVIVAEHEPPRKYLLALEDLTRRLPQNSALDISIGSSSWTPEYLSSDIEIDEVIYNQLEQDSEVMVQGPPGTGKTYVMAQICHRYLSQNKSVIVTALTNRALMELIDKEFLATYLASGRVLKKALTGDEKVEKPELRRIDNITVINGSLILSTYYSLSDTAQLFPDNPLFDLLIIEEASQAFLGTIGMFKHLAKKVIIIGDPVQLPPIWKDEIVAHLHPQISTVANGLKTYAYNNSECKAFRLIDSYRLPARAACLTGLFYENSIKSVASEKPPFYFNLPKEVSRNINPNGGPSFVFRDLSKGGRKPGVGLEICKNIVLTFTKSHPECKIAILSPFRITNSYLQANIFPLIENLENVIIETIDRIQGLTVDLAVILLPLDGLQFAFDLNRFNVATSRSKTHTIIIMDEDFKQLNPAKGLVVEYINAALKI